MLFTGSSKLADFGKMGKWGFEITGGFSSLTAYITEEASFAVVVVVAEEEEEEEEGRLSDAVDTPEAFSGEKLAGSGGDFARKGRRT